MPFYIKRKVYPKVKGKRAKPSRWKKVINNMMLICIVALSTFFVLELRAEEAIPEKQENVNIEKVQTNIEIIPKKEKIFLQEVEEEYQGYKVIAMLQIPKIHVNTCVLEEYSIDALYECVTKFYGNEPNEIGNFCIAGHNSKRKNMFTDIKQLEIGDEIILTSQNAGSLIYEVYDKYKVKPEDTSCLSQETDEIELTLISCTNDSSKRIIVKAKVKE